jgi:hypothetical protein
LVQVSAETQSAGGLTSIAFLYLIRLCRASRLSIMLYPLSQSTFVHPDARLPSDRVASLFSRFVAYNQMTNPKINVDV